MTTLTDTQVITASGGLVELGYAQVTTTASIGTTATQLIPSSGNLTVVCDGGPILVEVSIPYLTSVTSSNLRMGVTVDGVQHQVGILSPGQFVPGQFQYRLTPSAGSHTFTVYGFADQPCTLGAGNGTGGGSYVPAFLRVSKIVTATQWPAVTTGTIICTSSTRPGSPFEGQTIYETDTKRELRWDASAWVSPDVAFRPPMCSLYRSSAQSIPNGTSTVVTFPSGTEQIDTDTMHDDSTNNSRITIKTAGVYLVSFQFEFALSSGGGRRTLQLRKNGNPTGVDIELPSGGGYYPRASGSQIFSLAKDDYVDLSAYQDSGGSLNLEKCNFFAAWQGRQP